MRRSAACVAAGLVCGAVCGAVCGPLYAQDQCGLLNTVQCAGAPAAAARGAAPLLEGASTRAPSSRLAAALVPNRIGDLHLAFKSFDTGSARSGVGLTWDWSRRLTSWDLPENDANVSAFTWNATATGNAAFDPSTNPRDFLRTGTTLGWLFSRGGVTRALPRDVSLRIQDDIMRLATVPTDSLPGHPLNRRVLDEISRVLSPQVFITIDAQAAFETDQRFDQTQFAWGGRLGLDVKAWNPGSGLARMNVLDWPFAVLRYLTLADGAIRPRGSALPTVLLSLERVEALDDTVRARIGAADAYPRVSFEAGFRTLAARVASGELFAEANVRHYRELGADAAVRDVGLDAATLFVAALTGPGGMYVSYSTGRLPLDREDDRVYELGFRYRF